MQVLPKVFQYPLLPQELVKLQTSNLAHIHSHAPSEHKPIKILEKRERLHIHGLPNVFKNPYYLRNG